jgi:PIN domain nuclease of toxin-antitoxin system
VVLLDTHAFIWLASDQSQLSETAKALINRHKEQLFISCISALEIALLVKRERLTLPMEPDEYIESALQHLGIDEVLIDRRILLHSAGLPDIHNDPFDRVLIATAQIMDMTLLSKDRNMARYPDISVVWD